MANYKEIRDYIYNNKSLVLSTVDTEGNPQLRHIGAYAIDGLDIVFQTGATTEKIKELENNNNVALLFQHEGQETPKNLTIYGQAETLDNAQALEASKLIKERRPHINFDPNINVIVKVTTDSVKLLDFAKGRQAVVIPATDIV